VAWRPDGSAFFYTAYLSEEPHWNGVYEHRIGSGEPARRVFGDEAEQDQPPPAIGDRRRDTCAEPAGRRRGQRLGVDAYQQPPDRTRHRNPAGEPQPGPRRRVQIPYPVRDRRERDRTGQHRTHRYRQQAGQRITDPTRITRIGNRGQNRQQPLLLTFSDRNRRDRRGGSVR
jgi:hypothetical protein